MGCGWLAHLFVKLELDGAPVLAREQTGDGLEVCPEHSQQSVELLCLLVCPITWCLDTLCEGCRGYH